MPRDDEATDSNTHLASARRTWRAVAPRASRAPRVTWRRLVALVALVLATAVAGVVVQYRRQVVSYVTHRKGGPSQTWPYVPHDPAPELHLAVAGDVGEGGSRIDATGAAMARIATLEPYDALLLLGDNVYPAGDPERLPATVFGPFGTIIDGGAELLAILGNHDVKSGWGDEQMAALGMPGRYWAKEFGEVLIVGLDSNDLDAQQLEFLDRALAASRARWKIVAIHHPPYAAGYQGSSTEVRDALAPVLERHGVQLVLSGHEHDYERSMPINGVTYVVSGAGADTRRTGDDDFTAASYSWHHFLDIAITGDELVLRAVGQNGSVFDTAVLSAGP